MIEGKSKRSSSVGKRITGPVMCEPQQKIVYPHDRFAAWEVIEVEFGSQMPIDVLQ